MVRDKVVDSARDLGLAVEVQRFDAPTSTVGDAAAAVGCADARIAKSIVFVADGDPVVCVASGAHQIDPNKLADALDVAGIRLATASEVRAATGFSVGGVPPFGHGLPVILDEALLEHDRVFVAAGDSHTLCELDPRDLAERMAARAVPVGAA